MKYCDIFRPADILLPKKEIDMAKWGVIAVDQFTSDHGYWNEVKKEVGNAPSTLSCILPEIYLDQGDELLPTIYAKMEEYNKTVLRTLPDCYIYVERTQPDGRVRRGLVGNLDMEAYSFEKSSKAPVRATEATVVSRIPPRVKIREQAVLELPHILVLYQDETDALMKALNEAKTTFEKAYDFDLMQGGGHICGYIVPKTAPALAFLQKDEGDFLFAAGDGNHSLATAKVHYENLKKKLGKEAETHPARYALCEIENIFDKALDFEPIFRVMFHCDEKTLFAEWNAYIADLKGKEAPQTIEFITKTGKTTSVVSNPTHPLPVGTLQIFLDDYVKRHPETIVDYVHDEEQVTKAVESGAVGTLFEGMSKDGLFYAVAQGGSLPRKTFSMGHGKDKRYYIEARKIKG